MTGTASKRTGDGVSISPVNRNNWLSALTGLAAPWDAHVECIYSVHRDVYCYRVKFRNGVVFESTDPNKVFHEASAYALATYKLTGDFP